MFKKAQKISEIKNGNNEKYDENCRDNAEKCTQRKGCQSRAYGSYRGKAHADKIVVPFFLFAVVCIKPRQYNAHGQNKNEHGKVKGGHVGKCVEVVVTHIE